ncbi:hypothetical protein GCM10023322_45740 [Rugosimonospora acidiphila]|uniref:SRPBCC domain-containing protein n=1 Tax=Rugosimonospora acidiphila TaxID=556531 RepID=A0ABP9S3T0_9ACTN
MSLLSYEVRAEAEVAATAEEVWRVLTDLPGYPDWHPAIVETSGALRVGARQREVVRAGNGRTLTFRPVLTVVAPGRELTRRGRLLAPGIFTGVHSYRIEPAGDGRVRVMQAERLSGVLVPFLRGRLATDTRAQFEAALAGLAARLEKDRRR